MESLTKQFPDKETFDKFFVENFKTMTYEDVKEGLDFFRCQAFIRKCWWQVL